MAKATSTSISVKPAAERSACGGGGAGMNRDSAGQPIYEDVIALAAQRQADAAARRAAVVEEADGAGGAVELLLLRRVERDVAAGRHRMCGVGTGRAVEAVLDIDDEAGGPVRQNGLAARQAKRAGDLACAADQLVMTTAIEAEGQHDREQQRGNSQHHHQLDQRE